MSCHRGASVIFFTVVLDLPLDVSNIRCRTEDTLRASGDVQVRSHGREFTLSINRGAWRYVDGTAIVPVTSMIRMISEKKSYDVDACRWRCTCCVGGAVT